MKRYVSYILAVLAFIGLIILSSFMVLRNNDRKVTKIFTENVQANGNDFINDASIKKIMAKKVNFKQLTIGNLQADSMEYWLSKSPFVKKADVFHTPQGELMIRFEQKNPVLRVKNRNVAYYITDEFQEIPLSKVYSADVMLVSGEIEKNEYEGLVKLTQYINADNLLKNNITGITKEGKNCFILSVNLNSYKIRIGDLENIEKKFDNLKAFYEQYLSKIGLNLYKIIDISYKNQVIGVK